VRNFPTDTEATGNCQNKCMVYSNVRHDTNHVIASLDGHTIDQVKVYTYLEVWVDDKLSFTIHVDNFNEAQDENRFLLPA
jgi:hypothetical protein